MPTMKALFYALRFRFRDLPFHLSHSSGGIQVDIDAERNARWKGKPLSFDFFKEKFIAFGIELTAKTMTIPESLAPKRWKAFLSEIEDFCDLVAKENLHDTRIWGFYPNPHATGFKEGSLEQSGSFLKELYEGKFVVAEKKAFVIDLRRSQRVHLISVDENPRSFLDAAAQIGSLALGYNDPEKRGILTHPENYEWAPNVFESEVYRAYSSFLKKLTGLPHVYFFNSGAEANEAALQLCLRKFPSRRKLMAFNGSFHGRSLLTLHLTHSPAKRLAFESYPGLVNFAPFPENKEPSKVHPISQEWTQLWSSVRHQSFERRLEVYSASADPLLKSEIESLLFIKKAFAEEEYLATFIEPRQCEGGDRFGTPRFYHALRLLTRAYDVPLVFDEVQTGFGLGGPFFWHEQFDLRRSDGSRDHPDCLTFAKKGQVSGVLTSFESSLQHEVNLTSLHRGYLQAMSTFIHDPVDYSYVRQRLHDVQKLVGSDLLQHPRGQAQTFAFDLPSDLVLNKLISYRFEEGILFYPAGERTARFRLLRNFRKEEIDSLFTSLYRCFLRAAADKVIREIPPLEEWLRIVPSASEGRSTTERLERSNPWASLPSELSRLKDLKKEFWQNFFALLIKEQRCALHMESNRDWPLARLNSSSLEDLISHYKDNPRFTYFDLLWHASRQQGWRVESVKDSTSLSKLKSLIEEIERDCYEPARQTPYSDFEKCLAQGRGLILTAKEGENLLGIAACGPVENFNSLKLVADDPEKSDPDVYYSIDVTVKPEVLARGLGLRLKVEQILELGHLGAKAIKSRNRYPEAATMIRLNHGFGSQVLAFERKIYSDGGAAFYQSLRLHSGRQRIWNPRHPSMLNKGSLANFVSPAYIDNMLFLKDLLPPAYRHIYLASSRGEALDKAIKCLRVLRPRAKFMISFAGDDFGNTTASSANLSGETRYFDWPRFESETDPKFDEFLKATSPEMIFGCALEWRNNSHVITKRIARLRELGLSTILKDCRSTYWQGSKDAFIASGSLGIDPDITYFGLAPQLSVVACKESLFFDKPLMMISTWDGDEHGLCLFQDHALDSLERMT